jgi:hypothetical protein
VNILRFIVWLLLLLWEYLLYSLVGMYHLTRVTVSIFSIFLPFQNRHLGDIYINKFCKSVSEMESDINKVADVDTWYLQAWIRVLRTRVPEVTWSPQGHELSWVYLTADAQSTSSSWYRALLWGPWPDFILILSLATIALLFFLFCALSDERTGL